MPFLEWSEKYATDISVIDRDHKNLFLIVNVLHDSVESGSARTRLVSLLAALHEYVRKHFATEELLMRQANYPGLKDPMEKHRALMQKVHGFVEQYEEDPDSIDLDELLEFVKEWLTQHVLRTDMEYVDCVKEAGINGSKLAPADIDIDGSGHPSS